MSARNVYYKNCPDCSALLPADAVACGCGYDFAPGADASPEQQTAAEEALFEAYLAARLNQAVDALESARTELAADRDNFNRVLTLMRRLHELVNLRADFDEQRQRTAEARAAAAPSDPDAVGSPVPTPIFNAVQAQRAAETLRVDTGSAAEMARQCPACTSDLRAAATHCPACGYRLAPLPGGEAAFEIGLPRKSR